MHVLDCMIEDMCDQVYAWFDGHARLPTILAPCSEQLVLSYVDAQASDPVNNTLEKDEDCGPSS